MEKDQIIILENRGLISITGEDAKEFLQNIITNDIDKVSRSSSIFSALLNPQGKYLFDFFVIKKSKALGVSLTLERPLFSASFSQSKL